MKVIKGELEWKTEIICPHCKSVLEIEKKDLYVINTAMSYAGETWDPEMQVDCCVCETSIGVTKQVPYGIRNRMYLEKRRK